MATTFQKRMKVAIARAGGQSALARKINERYGTKLKPQNIQYLADENLEKPAQGSRHTPQIAAVSGLMADWLASETGPRDVPGAVNGRKAPTIGKKIQAAGFIEVMVKETGEMRRIEMTQDAIEVAIAFMDLPKRERVRFKRQIVVAALPHTEDRPDEKLEHLSAKEKQAQRKFSKHSN